MNLLKTDINGKQPIFLDDIRFNDNAYREAFASILKAIGVDKNNILHGCELTDNGGGSYSVTKGAVMIQSEVLKVDAQNFTCSNLNDCYYKLQETDDPNGLRVFGNLATHNVWMVRKAQIVEETSPDTIFFCSVNLVALAKKEYALIDHNHNNTADWITPTLSADWNNHLQYRREPNGIIHLNGWLQNVTMTTSAFLFEFPENYRPVKLMFFSAVALRQVSGTRAALIYISDTGALNIGAGALLLDSGDFIHINARFSIY